MLSNAKMAPNRRSAKRIGQHIIKPKATICQLKVADALRAEPAMPLPRKQSKIEMPWMTQNLLASADLSSNTGDGTLAFDTDKRTPPLPCAVLTAKSRTASPGAQHRCQNRSWMAVGGMAAVV
jgi:hypothetical protein